MRVGNCVATIAPHEQIVSAVSLKCVAELRACQVLDPDKSISFRIAAGRCSGLQADIYAGKRGRIGRGINPVSTIERVGAAKAGKRIVCAVADKRYWPMHCRCH